jgi:hypothetical protein
MIFVQTVFETTCCLNSPVFTGTLFTVKTYSLQLKNNDTTEIQRGNGHSNGYSSDCTVSFCYYRFKYV